MDLVTQPTRRIRVWYRCVGEAPSLRIVARAKWLNLHPMRVHVEHSMRDCLRLMVATSVTSCGVYVAGHFCFFGSYFYAAAFVPHALRCVSLSPRPPPSNMHHFACWQCFGSLLARNFRYCLPLIASLAFPRTLIGCIALTLPLIHDYISPLGYYSKY